MTMTEIEQLSKPDYIHNIQYSARDYPVPRFSKPQEIRGGITRPVKSIAFSCDGKKVATGCDMRGLRVWDAREKMDSATSFSLPSGGEKSSPHGGHVASLAWSPIDPNILISGCKNSLTGTYVAIWDIRTPKTPSSTHKLPSDILHISFHPSGSHFAVVCPRPQRDEVYFFHRIIGDEGEQWVKREDAGIGGAGADLGAEEINSLRFSNSGQFLCAVGNDGSLNAWSYPLQPRQPKTSGLSITTNGAHPSGIEEGDAMAGPSRPSSPSGANRRGGTPEVQVQEDTAEAEAEEAGEGGEDVDMPEEAVMDASAENGTPKSKEKSISLNISTSSLTPNTATVPPPTPSRAPSPPSQPSRPSRTAAQTQESYDRQLKRIKHSIIHSASLLALGLDPTGKYLAVGGQDALVSVFSTRDWVCTRTFDISTGAIRHIAFSPDGEMIAFGGDDQAIYIVSVHSGQTLAKIPVAATVNALSWHPQKNWLAYSVVSKGAIVWYMVQQE